MPRWQDQFGSREEMQEHMSYMARRKKVLKRVKKSFEDLVVDLKTKEEVKEFNLSGYTLESYAKDMSGTYNIEMKKIRALEYLEKIKKQRIKEIEEEDKRYALFKKFFGSIKKNHFLLLSAISSKIHRDKTFINKILRFIDILAPDKVLSYHVFTRTGGKGRLYRPSRRMRKGKLYDVLKRVLTRVKEKEILAIIADRVLYRNDKTILDKILKLIHILETKKIETYLNARDKRKKPRKPRPTKRMRELKSAGWGIDGSWDEYQRLEQEQKERQHQRSLKQIRKRMAEARRKRAKTEKVKVAE